MSALYDFTFTPSDDVPIGDLIAALLDAYLNPSSLARVLGVSRPAIYDWQKGAIPRPDTYDRIVELHSHLTAWETA